MVEGPNFYFGHDRTGTIDVLRQLTAAAGIALDVVEPLIVDGEYVSSSRIRRLLGEGQVDEARAAADRALSHSRHGRARRGPRREDRLPHGQSRRHRHAAARRRAFTPGAVSSNNTRWPAAINIGPNPTFGEASIEGRSAPDRLGRRAALRPAAGG